MRHVPRHTTPPSQVVIGSRTPIQRRSLKSPVLHQPASRDGTFVIDFFLSSHLGDALVTTPLARQLVEEKSLRVEVIKHRSTVGVFENNPYVSGFTVRRGSRFVNQMSGDGHMIQRLQRGLGLSVTSLPRPEVFFDTAEIAFAKNAVLGGAVQDDSKICIITTRVVTNARYYTHVDWQGIGDTLMGMGYRLIQPVMRRPEMYREQVGLLVRPHEWQEEPIIQGAMVLENLTTRQFMALFSQAALFVGGLTGGAHLAAALKVPSMVVLWPEIFSRLSFPSRDHKIGASNWPYPYHAYLESSQVTIGRYESHRVRDAVLDANNLEAPIPFKQQD